MDQPEKGGAAQLPVVFCDMGRPTPGAPANFFNRLNPDSLHLQRQLQNPLSVIRFAVPGAVAKW